MTVILPAAEAVDDVGQPGSGFRQVRAVDLRDIAQAHQLRPRARPRNQRLHLLGCQVLRFVEDDVAVEEGPPPHEVERTNLDAVSEQIVGRSTAPAAAFLALRQDLEVVHQRTHPGLHLFLFRAWQESDVLAQRDGDPRHDDLVEPICLEGLRETSGEREQRLARAGGAKDGHKVDLWVEQQIQREVLLAVAGTDAPDAVALAPIVANHLEHRGLALYTTHVRFEAMFTRLVHELVRRPAGGNLAAHAIVRASLLVPGLETLAGAVPEVRRPLPHARAGPTGRRPTAAR